MSVAAVPIEAAAAPSQGLTRRLLGWTTDVLLVATVFSLAIYPWAVAQLPELRPARVALGLVLAALVLDEALRAPRPRARLLWAALGALVLLQLVAVVRAPELRYGVYEFANWTLYLPLAMAVWSARRLVLVAAGVLAGGAVVLLGAGLQYVDVLGGTWGVATEEGVATERYTSFLQNPNDFGLVMALCTVIAAALAVYAGGWRRAPLIALVAAFGGGVVVSSSRGSLVALVLGCSALAIVMWRSRRRAALAVALLVAAVVAGSVLRDAGHSVVGAVGGDPSLEARWDRWRLVTGGVEPVDALVGAGYGGFATALDRPLRNVILNPGAEEGDLGWMPLTGASPIAVSPVAFEGGNSILVRSQAGSGRARLGLGGARTPVIPGRRYRFSALIGPTGPGTWAQLSVKWYERATSGFAETAGTRSTLRLGEWKRVGRYFVAPAEAEFATPVVSIGASGPEPAGAYIDAARFARVEPIFAAGSRPPLWAIRRELTVDNSFLRLFLEEGVLGVLAIVAVILAAIRARRGFGAAIPLAGAVAAIVLTMLLVRGATADLLSQPLWAFLLWLSVGLVAAAPPAAESSHSGWSPARVNGSRRRRRRRRAKVAVFVPNLNGGTELLASLESLSRQTVAFETVLVDNGSSDGSREAALREYPHLKVVELPSNRGFGPALNEAVRRHPADILIFTNNDVRHEPRFVEALLERIGGSPAAVAGVLLQDADPELIDSAGVVVDSTLLAFDYMHGLPASVAETAPPPLGPTGGAALVPRTTFEGVGGFDERILAYLEDVDLALRLRLAGVQCRLAPDARGIHKHSSTLGAGSRAKNRLMGWSRGYMLRRYGVLGEPRGAVRTAVAEAVICVGQAVVDRNVAGISGRVSGWRAAKGLPARPVAPESTLDLSLVDALRRRARRRARSRR